MEITLADGEVCPPFGGCQCGQEDGGQDRNYSDHYQKLDEGKPDPRRPEDHLRTPCLPAFCHDSILE
ncbi:MAG: hypothetical protein ACYDH9_24530 [Limisphaerales bacterium]